MCNNVNVHSLNIIYLQYNIIQCIINHNMIRFYLIYRRRYALYVVLLDTFCFGGPCSMSLSPNPEKR